MKPQDLADYLTLVLWPHCSTLPTATVYKAALQVREQTKYCRHDSQVIAPALSAGTPTLYSEDLQHERKIEPLAIANLFFPNP